MGRLKKVLIRRRQLFSIVLVDSRDVCEGLCIFICVSGKWIRILVFILRYIFVWDVYFYDYYVFLVVVFIINFRYKREIC